MLTLKPCESLEENYTILSRDAICLWQIELLRHSTVFRRKQSNSGVLMCLFLIYPSGWFFHSLASLKSYKMIKNGVLEGSYSRGRHLSMFWTEQLISRMFHKSIHSLVRNPIKCLLIVPRKILMFLEKKNIYLGKARIKKKCIANSHWENLEKKYNIWLEDAICFWKQEYLRQSPIFSSKQNNSRFRSVNV